MTVSAAAATEPKVSEELIGGKVITDNEFTNIVRDLAGCLARKCYQTIKERAGDFGGDIYKMPHDKREAFIKQIDVDIAKAISALNIE